MLGAEIGVDLGSTNTVIYQKDVGILYNEPSVVAYDRTTGTLLGFGLDALKKTSLSIGDVNLCNLTQNGAVNDYFGVVELLKSMSANRLHSISRNIDSISLAIRGELSKVQYRAYATAFHNLGARSVRFIPAVLLAAYGSGIDYSEPEASLFVHIGSSHTDIAIISRGRIIESITAPFGGSKCDHEIIDSIRRDKGIKIGAAIAERIKIEAVQKCRFGDTLNTVEVCGLNVETGLPHRIAVGVGEILDIACTPLSKLEDSIKQVLRSCSPEILSDIGGKGVVLTGGSALLPQLPSLLQMQLGLPVYVTEGPLLAVARGFEISFSKAMNLTEVYRRKIS